MTEDLYNAGESLRAARGHASTPERPTQAFRNPDLYGGYLRRRHARGQEIPESMIPDQLSDFAAFESGRPKLGSGIGYPARFSFDLITFYRTKGGTTNGNENIMKHTRYSPNGDVTERVMPYNESEFYTLMRLAKDRGFSVQVESGQGDVRIAA